MQKVNGQSLWVITSQATLNLAHWRLWFIPVSIQMVSVLAWMVTAVHLGTLPLTKPACIPGISYSFPTPYLGTTGTATGIGPRCLENIHTTGPSWTQSSGGQDLTLLQTGKSLNHSENWKEVLMEPIHNLLLDRKRIFYHSKSFLHQMLWRSSV